MTGWDVRLDKVERRLPEPMGAGGDEVLELLEGFAQDYGGERDARGELIAVTWPDGETTMVSELGLGGPMNVRLARRILETSEYCEAEEKRK